MSSVRGVATALIGGALVLLVAGPAGSDAARDTVSFNLNFETRVLADGTLELQRADGALRLSDEIAPPSHRAWRLSEDQDLAVDGRVERGRVLVVELTAQFDPATAGAQGPGVATVVIQPDDPGEPCGSGRWSSATAQITYDDGDGPVSVFTEPGRYATRGQGAACQGTSGPPKMDGAILIVSAADGPMP